MQVQIIRPDGRTIVVGGSNGPSTRREFEALQLQREEIAGQINMLRSRRNELDEQRHLSSGSARQAIEARIGEVDARRTTLESRLDQINEQIANAPASVRVVATTAEPDPNPLVEEIADNIVPLTGMLSVFFFLPLALAFARLVWKRGTAVQQRPAVNEQLIIARFEQLQTSMDAMSLEVERISEGQRYVTKLMSDRDKAALPR